MSTTHYADRILGVVNARGYKPQNIDELATAMRIGLDEIGDFHSACRALMRTGRVVLGSQQSLMLPDPPGKITGTFRGNERGFGFIIPDTPNAHGDLYIPEGKGGDAVTGDTVVARVLKQGKRDGKMLYQGHVVEIVERGNSRFVGELHQQGQRWFVIPDGNALHVPIVVGDPKAKNAKPHDQVVVEITQYPTAQTEARGVIAKVLGIRGEPHVDTLSIVEQYHLPGEFSKAVISETREVIKRFNPRDDAKGREDLSQVTTITIDPTDARDFDDAISLTTHRDGTMELGVHIADVAHFVRPGGALDNEARERSNSIYLPGMVIPMLPEALSNGVCSLQERQARLTKSAFITFSRSGLVKKSRLANTVIKSTKRLTYIQAGKILDGKPGRTNAKVVTLLQDMERLARVIHKRRLRAGMFELDLPDNELVFDEDGRVIDAQPAEAGYAHKIIEMFMVEANEAVARTLAAHDVPALRRVHDEPYDIASGGLRRFLAVLGHVLPENADRFAIQKLLVKTHGKPEAFAVHLAVLRSMKQAEYAPTPLGHYALASEDYTHFTSPIRRYPDLTIHRLIDAYLTGVFDTPKGRRSLPSLEEVSSVGSLCSANERRAEAAERELKLVLVLRLLNEKHLGDVFDGVVTGVANVGVFVQLERFLIDGLLRFDQLQDDWWEVAPSRGCVVGERSGRQITVGDRMKVRIARVQIPTRQLDLAPAEPVKRARSMKRGKGRGDSARSTSGTGSQPARSTGSKTRTTRSAPRRGTGRRIKGRSGKRRGR